MDSPKSLDQLEGDELKHAMAVEMHCSDGPKVAPTLMNTKDRHEYLLQVPHIPFTAIRFEKKLAMGAAGTVWLASVQGTLESIDAPLPATSACMYCRCLDCALGETSPILYLI